jgi:hypothetical protein
MITHQQALAAAFVNGWLFILLSVSGARGQILSLTALVPNQQHLRDSAGALMVVVLVVRGTYCLNSIAAALQSPERQLCSVLSSNHVGKL